MRTHGWGGATPASDEEANERILDAAGKAIDERGANIRVAEVARALEISRQTVCNYFPGNSRLVEAVANRSRLKFLERLAAHLIGITDPVDALVESLSFTLEWLPGDMLLNQPAVDFVGSLPLPSLFVCGLSDRTYVGA
jgi:AcrR family transcriptional regulator